MIKTCFCDSSPFLKPAWLVLQLRREFLRGTFLRVCLFATKTNSLLSVGTCVNVSCRRRHWAVLGFVKVSICFLPVPLRHVAALSSRELLPCWCFGPSAGTTVIFLPGETWGSFSFASGGVFWSYLSSVLVPDALSFESTPHPRAQCDFCDKAGFLRGLLVPRDLGVPGSASSRWAYPALVWACDSS